MVKESTFLFNYGLRTKGNLSRGGVFYIASLNIKNFTFERNKFLSNKADVGGILYLEKTYPFLNHKNFIENNLVLNNKGRNYGDNVATKIYQFF